MGSFKPTENIDIPINGVFVMGLTLMLTFGVWLFMYRSRMGLHMRATVQNRTMSGAVGINTKLVDRFTFCLGCGIAGLPARRLPPSVRPDRTAVRGISWILFLVWCLVEREPAGNRGVRLRIAQGQSITEFFLEGTMGKVAILLGIVIVLMIRPKGLFPSKVRSA